ncbi:MAG: DnaT-like ssDNA-binding protein [Vicinamibacterales bacterium]
MALTVVATAGASTANSYCTRAEANTYHEAHPYASTWDAAGDTDKDKAIVTATRLLDEHVEWEGVASTTTQALGWPRIGLEDLNGNAIDSAAVPQKLKDAVAEFARWILAADRMADSDVEAQNLRSLKAGPVALEFGPGVRAKVIPDAVWYMVRQWGTVRQRSGASVPLERV